MQPSSFLVTLQNEISYQNVFQNFGLGYETASITEVSRKYSGHMQIKYRGAFKTQSNFENS